MIHHTLPLLLTRETELCPHCGGPSTVEIKVSHTSREGKWEAVCNEYANEQVSNTEDHNQHELANFGGAYGLCSIEIRPLTRETRADADEVEALIDEAFPVEVPDLCRDDEVEDELGDRWDGLS